MLAPLFFGLGGVLMSSEQKCELPESILGIMEGRIFIRCRMAWRDLETDECDCGSWHELIHEESYFVRYVNELNERHRGRMKYWIDYKATNMFG